MSESIISLETVIGQNLIGTCTGNIVKAPSSFVHSVVRSWDYNGTYGYLTGTCVMTFINTSAGVYNWNTFDELFSNNADKQIVFCFGATPDYLVSRAAIGGSYKGTKGNMCPDDLSGWAVAVSAVVNRAKNTFGRTGLIWQLWNEIDQSASYADTISLLGPYTKATVQAIRAIDPTAIIIGPTIAGANPVAIPFYTAYLSSSDGAGGQANNWIDGVCFHYYNQSAAQLSQNEHPIHYCNAWSMFTGAIKEIGVSLPVYMTETGVLAADTNGWRAYQRRLMTFAALGAKLIIGYQYDASSYPINIYEAQWNEIANILRPGAVITSFKPGFAKMEIVVDDVRYWL